MDWIEHVMSAVVGACFGVGMVLTWRRMNRPKPVDRHEIPRLRKEIIEFIETKDGGGEHPLFRDVDIQRVKEEKGVEYLRLYARFCKDYPLSNIRISSIRSSSLLLRMATREQTGKNRGRGYTDYGTNVELSKWHVDLSQAFNEAEKEFGKPYASKAEMKEAWDNTNRLIMYAYCHPDEADKMVSIVRDRHILDLEVIKSLLKDMDTPGSGAISSGAL